MQFWTVLVERCLVAFCVIDIRLNVVVGVVLSGAFGVVLKGAFGAVLRGVVGLGENAVQLLDVFWHHDSFKEVHTHRLAAHFVVYTDVFVELQSPVL